MMKADVDCSRCIVLLVLCSRLQSGCDCVRMFQLKYLLDSQTAF